jgi:hypothetical protein
MRRSSILALGCLLGLSLMLGQMMARPTSGQAEAAPSRPSGRFQMSVATGGVIVIDTSTGHCWVKMDLEGRKWNDLGSPVEQKKE